MLTFSCEPPDPLCLICSYMLLLAKSQSHGAKFTQVLSINLYFAGSHASTIRDFCS